MKADRVMITARIDRELNEHLKAIAKAQDRPLSRIYREALEQYAIKFPRIKYHAQIEESDHRKRHNKASRIAST